MTQDASSSYIQFVEEQIENFKKAGNLVDSTTNEVTPMMLNSSLAVYSRVSAMLNSEYQKYKWNLIQLKRKFEKEWDQWFSEKKKEMYEDKPKSFKLAVSEIESEVRVQHAVEFEALQDDIVEAEVSCDFLLKLMDQWKAHAKILEILSNNMRQEIASLSIDNRMNNGNMKVIRKEDPPIARRRSPG